MKIVFVSYHYWPPHFGGELKICIERFQAFIGQGHSVTVYTSGIPGFQKREIINGISIERSPIIHDSRIGRGLRRLIFPVWTAFKINVAKFDILHHGGTGGIGVLSHSLGMLLINLVAHHKGAKTVYVHSLADTEREKFANKGFKHRIRNTFLNEVDAIVSVSPALQASVQQVFPNHSRLILNGVRDDIFFPVSKAERDQLREEYQIRNEDVVFSFLGSPVKRKGFDLLVKAFLGLMDEYPSWQLWVVGPNSKKQNQNMDDKDLDNLLSTYGEAQSRIRFWGRIDDGKDLSKIINASDIFVLPTRKEGMPLAPMEAMAAGIPLIITRIPGVTDLANIAGVTGIFIEVDDLNGLKDAMIQLGTNENLRLNMGKAAHERINDHFGWERHVDDWERLFRDLTDHNTSYTGSN